VSVVAERGVVGGFPVHDYLQKPINGTEVLASLSRAGVAPDKDGTILVVDDDPSALKLMCATLGQLGYSTECAADGEVALDMAAKRRPLAVVLDLLMPKVDGFDFLLRFRGSPDHRSIPVVIWTMKDLTAGDHARLRDLAQAILVKGSSTQMTEQLRDLLPPPRVVTRTNHERTTVV
jgi:CheY-like chemotaxis protein